MHLGQKPKLSGLDKLVKKNLRKKIVADAEQKAADVEAEHRSKVDEERDRLPLPGFSRRPRRF